MPSYVVSDNEFKNAIKRFGITNEKLNDAGYQFEESERKLLSKMVNTFSADGDGEIPPITNVISSLKRFTDLPESYLIPIKDVEDFNNKIKNEITIPTNHELTFRFYFGHNNNTTGKLTYSMVIVPIASPLITPSSVRDHSKDIEKSLLKNFFALVASSSKTGIETDLKTCSDLLVNKDASGTFLVYFSFDRFNQFKTKLISAATNLLISFGRTITGSITILLSFTDSDSNAIPSSIMAGGIKSDGIFFDQGDLIPPPPVSDSSF